MGQIILPNDRKLIPVPEVISLLSEQSALSFFDHDYGAVEAFAAKSGEAGRPARRNYAGNALAERLKRFRLVLERRAWTRFLLHAVLKSKSMCLRNSSGAPQAAAGPMAESYVATAELANWLLGRGFAVSFDPPISGSCPAAATSSEAALLGLRRKLRKSALIDELRDQWPTIRSDLGKAATNGLSAARIDGRHGMYDVQVAIGWAREHGRIMAADPVLAERRAAAVEPEHS